MDEILFEKNIFMETSIEEVKKSPFDGVKTLQDINKDAIFLALRETREEN